MKQLALFLITCYQVFISPLFATVFGMKYICRYEKTCSVYAKEVISKKGVIIGGYLALKRILSCQPFSKQSQYGKSL